MNDYLIKLSEDTEVDDRSLGRHFQIQYKLSERKFYIKDLGKGFGAFMKIKNSYQLFTDSLINIGDTYIVVSIGEEETNNSNNDNNEDRNTCITNVSMNLNLKIFSGTFKFNPM